MGAPIAGVVKVFWRHYQRLKAHGAEQALGVYGVKLSFVFCKVVLPGVTVTNLEPPYAVANISITAVGT